MKRLLISLILGLIASLPLLAMEKPQAPRATPSETRELNRVPALTILAARKCGHIVNQFDPEKDYDRAVAHLNSLAMSHVAAPLLRPHLVAQAADRLEAILENEIEPKKLNFTFDRPLHNLYEKNRGICDDSEKTFFPKIEGKDSNPEYHRVIFSSDKKMCVTYGQFSPDLKLTLWDVSSGTMIKTITFNPQQNNFINLRARCFTPDDKVLLAEFEEMLLDLPNGMPNHAKHMCAFDVETGQQRYENRNIGLIVGLHCGKKYMYLPEQHGLQVRDMHTNAVICTVPIPEPRTNNYCISPQDDYVISSEKTGKLLNVFDAKTGAQLRTIELPHAIKSACLNHDGTLLATVSDTQITFWNPYSARQITAIAHFGRWVAPKGFCFNDLGLITIDRNNNTVCFWGIESEKILTQKKISGGKFTKKHKGIIDSFTLCDDDCIGIAHLSAAPHCPNLMYTLHTAFAKELTLKELSALLILEHNVQNNEPLNMNAYGIVANSASPLLKKIFAQRYEMDAENELEMDFAAQKKQWLK